MTRRLVRVLGPARALRVAQAVARHGGPVLGGGSVQSSKAPGHAKDVARPKQDVCCNWLALTFCSDAATIGCVGCCVANPALFAAWLAAGTAACVAANCWVC